MWSEEKQTLIEIERKRESFAKKAWKVLQLLWPLVYPTLVVLTLSILLLGLIRHSPHFHDNWFPDALEKEPMLLLAEPLLADISPAALEDLLMPVMRPPEILSRAERRDLQQELCRHPHLCPYWSCILRRYSHTITTDLGGAVVLTATSNTSGLTNFWDSVMDAQGPLISEISHAVHFFGENVGSCSFTQRHYIELARHVLLRTPKVLIVWVDSFPARARHCPAWLRLLRTVSGTDTDSLFANTKIFIVRRPLKHFNAFNNIRNEEKRLARSKELMALEALLIFGGEHFGSEVNQEEEKLNMFQGTQSRLRPNSYSARLRLATLRVLADLGISSEQQSTKSSSTGSTLRPQIKKVQPTTQRAASPDPLIVRWAYLSSANLTQIL